MSRKKSMNKIAGAPAGSRRILSLDGEFEHRDVNLSIELEGAMLSDTVFTFLDGSPESSVTSSSSSGGGRYGDDDVIDEEDHQDGDDSTSSEENKAFWEKQHKILKETLCKTSSTERAIRNATKESMKEMQAEGTVCVCSTSSGVDVGDCKRCLMREISRRLRSKGYDAAVTRSKWRSSPEIPAGEHTFILVTDNSNPTKGEVRVIIELSFRAEFELAKAGEEYSKLINRLPEAFVGRVDRLKSLVKILCSAAKKCCNDKRIHIGPWRKHKYMQAKWFNSCENMELGESATAFGKSSDRIRTTNPRASMLTVALLDIARQPQAVAVV